MSEIEQQLKSALGGAGYWALMQVLKKITIGIDTNDQVLVIYRHNRDPVRIVFEDIEDYVNNIR